MAIALAPKNRCGRPTREATEKQIASPCPDELDSRQKHPARDWGISSELNDLACLLAGAYARHKPRHLRHPLLSAQRKGGGNGGNPPHCRLSQPLTSAQRPVRHTALRRDDAFSGCGSRVW